MNLRDCTLPQVNQFKHLGPIIQNDGETKRQAITKDQKKNEMKAKPIEF